MIRTGYRLIIVGFAIVLTGFAPATDADQDHHRTGISPEFEAQGLDENPIPEAKDPNPSQPKNRSIVEAVLVAQEDDVPVGGLTPVVALNSPFTNGSGNVGFTGSIGENFVWFGNGIHWLNSDGLPTLLTAAEYTMGIGDLGEFIYSPSINGADGVWTDQGLLAVENVQAPAMPTGWNSTFHSRPTMLPSGQAYWVAGLDPSGGFTTNARVLYTSIDGTPATIAPVLQSGDMVGNYPISDGSSGIDFDYQISDNALHHINLLNLDTGSTSSDGIVYVDGVSVAGEATPSGTGDNWDNFDTVSINNAGNYLFSGDTDGDTATDEFVAYNGVITIREGDTIDGVELTSSASVQAVSINNLGHAAHIWSYGGGEDLFFACSADDLAAESTVVLAVLDEVDLDANGTGDATVIDFNASTSIGSGLSLAEDGKIYVEVDLRYGAIDREAIIRLDLPVCTLFADGFESGDTDGWSTVFP